MQINTHSLIVVLGMHRSGTSALTRGLPVMGMSLGDRMMQPVAGNNPKGFWEDIDINRLNVEMLEFLHSDWHHLAPIERSELAALRRAGYFLRASVLLRQKVSSTPCFACKDPRIIKLLPFWQEIFRHCQLDVRYVLAIRHPLSVVESLMKRDGFHAEKGYLLWLSHVIQSLVDSAANPRVVVDYDRLINSPAHELGRLAAQFELTLDSEALAHYQTEFLDPGLRHTVYHLDDLSLDSACPPLVQEIYAALLAAATDCTPLNDPELLDKIQQWAGELKRLNSALILADKLAIQHTIALKAVIERDRLIASLTSS